MNKVTEIILWCAAVVLLILMVFYSDDWSELTEVKWAILLWSCVIVAHLCDIKTKLDNRVIGVIINKEREK